MFLPGSMRFDDCVDVVKSLLGGEEIAIYEVNITGDYQEMLVVGAEIKKCGNNTTISNKSTITVSYHINKVEKRETFTFDDLMFLKQRSYFTDIEKACEIRDLIKFVLTTASEALK